MLCPHCKTPLSLAERSNIEIDYCPTCRGVWLDRGELDKLIERAAPSNPPAENRAPQFTTESRPFPQDAYEQEHHHWGKHGHHKHHRKKSFLSEIFDFD